MKKIVLCILVFLGSNGFCGYKESSFFFDRNETPRAVHFTANGFKASATYQLKFYAKTEDAATQTQYVKVLSKDNQWLSVDEDSWPLDLPTFTTEDNGYKEGWVYVKNAGMIDVGSYTCAFSVKEVGTGGEIMKPGIFRPLTIMDMTTDGGWLAGIVRKNGQPAENSHLVFLAEDGKVLGAVDSEPNCISGDNPETPGYFKIALPAGTKVSTITDWDGNVYGTETPKKGMGPENNQGGPWVIVAGEVTTAGMGILGSPVTIIITANPSTVNADNGTTTVIGTVTDGGGNPCTETTVYWSLDGIFKGTSSSNSSGGTATFTIGSLTLPGIYTITATTTTLSTTTTITVIAGSPTIITLTAPGTVSADIGTTTAYAYIQDKNNNPCTETVCFSLNGSYKGTDSTKNGTATFTIGSLTLPGIYTITATTTTLSTTTTITIIAGEPATIILAAAPVSVNVNVGVATIVGYVTDRVGNSAKNGTIVYWTTGSGTIPATSTTVNGTATAVFSCKIVGTYTITGTVTFAVTNTTTIAVMSRAPAFTLNDVFCYPNPCRVYNNQRRVTFTRLTAQATIRIFNVAGEEVVEKIEKNDDTTDTKVWDVPNKLSSGVYIYLIEALGVDKKVGKLGIIK